MAVDRLSTELKIIPQYHRLRKALELLLYGKGYDIVTVKRRIAIISLLLY